MPVALLVGGCLRAELVECADGRACAVGLACDDVHRTCVDPAQLEVCANAEPLAPCEAGTVAGLCFGGVCLEPGCGNGEIEGSEACDDGNRVSDDGCSRDCTTNETCSNGVRDSDEICDDGNLIDHDGCDSRCGAEQLRWETIPIAPAEGYAGYANMAYDEDRDRVVAVSGSQVWEWDGARWSMTVMPSSMSAGTLVFDRDRRRVMMFGGMNGSPVLADWDGISWDVRTASGTPPNSIARAVFLPDRHAVLVFDSAQGAWLLDSATATWTPAGTTPFYSYNIAIGYDDARQRVVAINGGRLPCCSAQVPPVTWEWDGMAWTSFAAHPVPYNRHQLVFDPQRGRLLSIGGTTTAEAYECCETVSSYATIEAWDGGQWAAVAPALDFPPADYSFAWYAALRGTIGLVAGNYDAWELADAAIDRTIPHPRQLGAVAVDLARDRVIVFNHSLAETWAWTDRWQRLATTAAPPYDGPMAYDPIRRALVLVDRASRELWLFDDDWHQLGVGTTTTAFAAAYDYAGRRLVVTSAGGTSVLDSASGQPMQLPTSPSKPGISGSIAFDPSNQRIVGLDASGALFDLVGDQWVQTLSPGPGYRLLGSLIAGSLLLIPPSYPSLPAWERRGFDWHTVPWPPPLANAVVVERPDGTLTQLSTTIVLERRAIGAGPAEACVAGEDADGDGLVGCADRDCWLTCTPACPPTMSCPP